jgi:hypothetical protein
MAVKITKEMEALKAGLDVTGENRQWWLGIKIFPFIRWFDSSDVAELCEYFGIEVSEFQAWKWLSQMPAGHLAKVRRRVEDRLRKGTSWEILKVADILGVSTTTE